MVENLIMVGPTRCATTSLFRTLSSYDCIAPSKLKEANYFLSDSASSYNDIFNSKQKDKIKLLEASPKYFMYSEIVAKRIYEQLPHAKIIIVLRDPYKRLRSILDHILIKRSPNKFESIDMLSRQQIACFDNLKHAGVDIDRLCLYESMYSIHLKNYLNIFPSDNVFITFYDDVILKKDFTLLIDFLGLDDEGLGLRHDNKTRTVKSKFLHSVALKVNNKFEPFLNRNPFIRDGLRKSYYKLFERQSSVSYDFPGEFVELIHNDLRKTKEVLISIGFKNFPNWLEGI